MNATKLMRGVATSYLPLNYMYIHWTKIVSNPYKTALINYTKCIKKGTETGIKTIEE